MSNIVTDKIIPDSGSSNTLTVGGTGDSVVVLDSLNVNSLQDAGGNNIFVSNGSGTVTSKNSGLSGALNLISTQTASGAASLSFTSGLDSTYDVYCFRFIDINPATNLAELTFTVDSDGGASYGMTKTSTAFHAYNAEGGGGGVEYQTGQDLAQSTSPQQLNNGLGNLADECLSGELYLFAPSSTTYVKHYYSRCQFYHASNYSEDFYIAGYINSTSAVNAIKFAMDSGNFDGVISMYGISKS